MATVSLTEELAMQIERVSELRGIYRSMENAPNVNVRPVIAMITESLDRARAAIADSDIGAMIRSVRELQEYKG